MKRRPFNPQAARGSIFSDGVPAGPLGPNLPSGSDAARPLQVAEVAAMIGLALERALPPRLRVLGEMSNLSQRSHWYFSLKDGDALIRCVAWASKARSFGFAARDGMQVIATGHIEFYGPQGQTQLYVDRLEPVGEGPLEVKFRALCNELRSLGYFDSARKRQLPVFPRRIAVITSLSGAALQDVLDTARRRCPAVEICTIDVRVQGVGAAEQIADALKFLARKHRQLRIDAVLLTRGGGSIEDLWAFNERVVADALLDFPIPTVAAIGHESDTTIAELVADLRCATPTQAAMRLTPDRNDLRNQLNHVCARLSALLRHRQEQAWQRVRTARAELGDPRLLVEHRRLHLREVSGRLGAELSATLHHARRRFDEVKLELLRVRPTRLLARSETEVAVIESRLRHVLNTVLRDRARDLDQAAERCRLARRNALRIHADRLSRAESRLAGLDPRSILQRGYSITRGPGGRILRSIREVGSGSLIQTMVSDGAIDSRVLGRALRSNSTSPDMSLDTLPPQLELFGAGG